MTVPDYLDQVVVSGRRSSRPASVTGESASRWRPSVTSVVWAALDFLTVVLAGLIVFRIRLTEMTVPIVTAFGKAWHFAPLVSAFYLVLFGVYLVVFSRNYGLYRVGTNESGLHEQRMTVQATVVAALLLCGTLYLSHGYVVSRISLTLTVLLTMFMLMARRAVWRRVIQQRYLQGLDTRNVLIVGNGRVGHALRNHLEALRHMGFRFKGFVSLTPLNSAQPNGDVIGDISNCVAMARSLFVDEIYFSTPADKQTVISVVEEARSLGIEVRVVPDLYDGLAWNARVEYIGQFPTIPLHRREFPRGAFLLKRAIDVCVSLTALVVLFPLFLFIALLIRIGSPGPVFYRGQRIGRKGRTFTCFKFRTMVQDADKKRAGLAHMNEREGVLFKITNDPRVTRIGAWLRKYSLDELPQFFNVLRGDMSLVGPRPPIASEVEQYELAHLRRLDVLPGMTGLWQVEARQDPSFDSYISLDTAYVENWNVMLDLRILARTIGVVLGGTGS